MSAFEAVVGPQGQRGGIFYAYAVLSDTKSANTSSGTPTTGAWTKHTLNTEEVDADGIVSLASDVMTIPAGTYYATAWASCYNTDRFKIKLRNTTASTDLVIGHSAVSTSAGNDGSVALLAGEFTLSASSTVELQYYAESSNGGTRGLGVETNFSVSEKYAGVTLYKIITSSNALSIAEEESTIVGMEVFL